MLSIVIVYNLLEPGTIARLLSLDDCHATALSSRTLPNHNAMLSCIYIYMNDE